VAGGAELDRLAIVRDCYRAYETGDRSLIERHLSDDLRFFSPPDPGIDREEYFERCWANADLIAEYEFVRLEEVGDEVLVTYEATKTDGRRMRNTEIFGFDGEQICRVEVYFGWNLD
jgi:ketosteroid isomerase-like protein